MSKADEFLRLYNELSKYLSTKYDYQRKSGFSRMVDIASRKDPSIRNYKEDLRDFADLRNAIVHHRSYPEEIIADPHPRIVAKFKRIVREIIKPRLVYPTFRRTVTVFSYDEPLKDALKHMQKNDFSQIVTRDYKGKLNLLTSEGITKWLSQKTSEDIISLNEYSVADVIKHEDEGQFMLMDRYEQVAKARDAFDNSSEPFMPELCAIIITQKGISSEKPLGIITPWDVLDIKNQ